MTTYYVRPGGLDANTGTGPAAADAWLTIGKALGAAGIASGDTVYVAPGTYREAVTVAMTSATAETKVIGDVSASQFTDLQGGDVIWIAYTTNDTSAPAASPALTLSSRDFLTFENIFFIGGTSAVSASAAGISTNITFTRCVITNGAATNDVISVIPTTTDTPLNWTLDSCVVYRDYRTSPRLVMVNLSGVGAVAADYDLEFVIKNCLLVGGGNAVRLFPDGISGAGKPGGVKIYNSTLAGAGNGLQTSTASTSAGSQCEVYNCIIIMGPGVGLTAGVSGQIVEDYNWIVASTTHTNVTQGAATVVNYVRAPMLEFGQSFLNGRQPRSWMAPLRSAPQLGFGNQSVGVTTDWQGLPRPSGGVSASAAIGYSERGNTFAKETGTVRTGTNAISITGPGTQDFQLPVDATSTTCTVYVRWDATYAGTKPLMKVLNGEEAGVTAATATATGSSGAWEQLSLNFTPARIGIVTIRLQSSDTNGAGVMFADDFSVA